MSSQSDSFAHLHVHTEYSMLDGAAKLPEVTAAPEPRPGRPAVALVVRAQGLHIGLLIQRMEMVIPAGRGRFSQPAASTVEHPVVAGFLELPDRPGLTVTVLEGAALLARLDRLKYLDTSDI